MLRRGRSGQSPSTRPTIVDVVEVAVAGGLIVDQVHAGSPAGAGTKVWSSIAPPHGDRQLVDRPGRIVDARRARRRARASVSTTAARARRSRAANGSPSLVRRQVRRPGTPAPSQSAATPGAGAAERRQLARGGERGVERGPRVRRGPSLGERLEALELAEVARVAQRPVERAHRRVARRRPACPKGEMRRPQQRDERGSREVAPTQLEHQVERRRRSARPPAAARRTPGTECRPRRASRRRDRDTAAAA